MIRIDASKPFDDNVRRIVYGGRDAHRTLFVDDAMGRALSRDTQPMPLWQRVELALAQPCLAMGNRGVERDVAKLTAAYNEGIAAIRPLLVEADALVRQYLPAWNDAPLKRSGLRFELSSGHQLKQALFNKYNVPPCSVCGNTGTVVVAEARTIQLYELVCECAWGTNKHGRPKRPPRVLHDTPITCPHCNAPALPAIKRSGPEKGQPIVKSYKERSRKCSAKHALPGFRIRAYHDSRTGSRLADRKTLGKALQRELGRSTTLVRYAEPSVALLRLALRFSELLKVPQECLAPGKGLSIHQPASTTRMPSMYNIGLPVTHRLSSESTPYGEGRNSQNLDHRTRRAGIYIPRAGAYAFSVDQAKAESHLLAAFAEDEAYLEAHEGACDTHALVAHWIWPELDWPADRSQWKRFAATTPFTKVAGLPYSVPEDNIRQASKKTQHTVGRGGGGDIVAQDLGTHSTFGDKLITMFLERVPRTMQFIESLRTRLANCEVVHLGVRLPPNGLWLPPTVIGPAIVIHVGHGIYWWRTLLTDPRSKDTFKDALAFALQSPSALISNLALLRLWNTVDNQLLYPANGYQLLLQKHDALSGEATIPNAAELTAAAMRIELVINGRPLRIPVEIEPGKLV